MNNIWQLDIVQTLFIMSVWIFCPNLFVVEMCAVFVRTVLVYVDKIAAQVLLTASIPAITLVIILYSKTDL